MCPKLGSMRAALLLCCALAAEALQLRAPSGAASRHDSGPHARASPTTVVMREPDARSKSREQLLPDLRKALDDVAVFISEADASRMRKPEAPTAASIEAYCAVLQKKVDLLMAEAKLMQETGDPSKVKWSDIDGNLYNDAVWLKPESWKEPP